MCEEQRMFVFGSAEIDQFEPRNEDNPVEKRPIELKYFSERDIKLVRVICGSLHTLALTTNGEVYSWGCNDDFALGRKAENEKTPGLVPLEFPVDIISAGDSHSIACNSRFGIVYFWGSYRSEIKGSTVKIIGRFYGPIETPIRVGEQEFKGKQIKKIVSGENHAMVLCDDRVFVWGDPDTGCLGRKPVERRKFLQCLLVEKIKYKNVVDIYSGKNHSFCRCLEKGQTKYYGWGLNNWGQLGIGQKNESDLLNLGDELFFFRNMDVLDMQGGSHHTIALLNDKEGRKVYTFGKNDDGQLGIGQQEVQETGAQLTQSEKIQNINRSFRASPQPLDLQNINKIISSQSYNYAIDENQNVYSWGMGDNYVLGNLKDLENEFTPYLIPEKFFGGNKPFQVALGSQHVVYTVQQKLFKIDEKIYEEIKAKLKSRSVSTKVRFSKKSQVSQEKSQSKSSKLSQKKSEGQSQKESIENSNEVLDDKQRLNIQIDSLGSSINRKNQTQEKQFIQNKINEIQIKSQTIDESNRDENGFILNQNIQIQNDKNINEKLSENTTPKFQMTPTFSEQKSFKMRQWDTQLDDQYLDSKKKI